MHYEMFNTEDFDAHLALAREYLDYAHSLEDKLNESTARHCIQIIHYNYNRWNDYLPRLEDDLDFMREHDKIKYFYARSLMVDINLMNNNFQEALDIATDMYNEATELNYNYGKGMAASCLGITYMKMNKAAEAEESLHEAIRLLKNEEEKNVLFECYTNLCRTLDIKHDHTAMLPVIDEWERQVRQEEERTNTPPHPVDWFNINTLKVLAAVGTEDFKKAEYHLNIADSIATTMTAQNRIYLKELRLKLLDKERRYHEALALTDILYNDYIEMGHNNALLDVLDRKGEYAIATGNHEVAALAYKELVVYTDSIRTVEITAQLDQLRTRFEVDRHILEKTRNRNYAIFATAGLVLALLALVVWSLYSRRLARKNRSLVERIREQDRLQSQLQACRTTRMEPGSGTLPQDELFERITLLVDQGCAYTDPALNRTSLAALVGSNENYIRISIQRNTGKTVNDYLNSLRLRHARELLADKSLTIENVAIDSGFGARSSFHKIFRKEYGLTPDEFRHFAKRNG